MNLFEALGLIGACFGIGLAYGFSGGAVAPIAAGAAVALPAGWLVFARFRNAALTAKLVGETVRLQALYWATPVGVGATVMITTWAIAEVIERVAA